jgi:hypothetical protein
MRLVFSAEKGYSRGGDSGVVGGRNPGGVRGRRPRRHEYRFESYNGLQAAADGACLVDIDPQIRVLPSFIRQLTWTGDAWITGLTAQAGPELKIHPGCAPSGAGPDNLDW